VTNLPFSMREDVEITFTLEGTATEVLAELRALRVNLTRRKAIIRTVTLRPGNFRKYEDQYLPAIVDGNASAATEKVNTLVRQRLLTPETERHLDDVIGALEILTRGS
jgi:hypothetical protein